MAKAVLRMKLKTVYACINKEEGSQINTLTLHHKEFKKEKQNKYKLLEGRKPR